MAKTNEMRLKAKQYKDRPVCVTLHSGETYIGYITDVNNRGVVLTGGGTISRKATSGRKTSSSKQKSGPRANSTRAQSRKRINGTHNKPSTHSRTASRAQVSSFLPMMGSLFGGLGGAGSLGGMLGGGMRLFGMIQQFVPVVKMGYGMIKQIQPFMGAVQGLMSPQSQAQSTQAEAEENED